MRTILLSRTDESYLQKCAVDLGFAFGIIIGHVAEPDKYVLVHLAKNSEEDADTTDAGESDEGDAQTNVPTRMESINTQCLTNQWISASKMIPGSFSVLGLFATSVNPSIVEEQTFTYAKKVLWEVHNLLQQGSNFKNSVMDESPTEYVFLAYASTTKKSICKAYEHSSNGGTFSPMDCRIVEKPFEWYNFETCYDFDDIFPITDHTQRINIEQQFHHTVESVRRNLLASEIFIQNESVDNTQTLEAFIKRKYSNSKTLRLDERTIKANIYLPVKCQLDSEQQVQVRRFHGTIRFSGVISSRIWCNPRNTFDQVKRYLCEDILRSLAARIQMYCDGLTEANVSNDAIFISEPPRRVYFNLSQKIQDSPIQFSEYIFRGEAPTVAVAQAKQILDLDIKSNSIVADVEGLPDDQFGELSSSSCDVMGGSNGSVTANRTGHHSDLTRRMYLLGIVVALLVLLTSILLHVALSD